MPRTRVLQPGLLLTRPEPAARRFAARLARPGLGIVISPVLRIEPRPHDRAAIDAARGLVFTSVHGVRAAGAGRGRPAICVGPATAKAARKAGFAVTVGPGDAQGMLGLLGDLGPGWLHPHGAHLAQRLPVPGVVVYDQIAQPLTAEAVALLAGPAPVVLPLFSPRSAALVATAVGRPRAALWVAPISARAAAAWQAPQERMVVAPSPDAAGVAAAVETLLGTEQSP